jgi:hypothetical protein
VRIAYFDEAGVSSEEQEPIIVVGGVLIRGDRDWHRIERAADEIVKHFVPARLQPNFVFHAYRLFGDHRQFKSLISAEQRFAILREFLTLFGRFKLPISYGAVDRAKLHGAAVINSKPKNRTLLAHNMALHLCAEGFQGWFYREARDEVAICVAERNEERQLTLKQNFAVLRNYGIQNDPLTMLHNFIDALHFAGSEESIGLQLADSVAFMVKRHLMGKTDSEEFYNSITPQLVCTPKGALWPLA